MSRVDAYHATRIIIENAFSHLTWHEDVCEKTGFKGISQVWKEDPAWYFWLDPVGGAFLLRLHAEEPISDNQYLSLSLHYFPVADEESYQLLSTEEKGLLGDESIFDLETNTPQFEAYDQFISQFIVAEIGFVIDPENDLQLLLYSSEKGENHPVHFFISLLVNALNFQSKRHHLQAFLLQEDSMKTTFLSYSEPVLQQFLASFGLDLNLFDSLANDDKLNEWLHAAHLDAVCSMSSSCSCSH
jgi:hypothetical protein